MANFYDVVVVGAQLGSLAAGALLARRGFRVLVLGHDDPPAGPATPFTVVGADAPPLRRLLQELALSQLFRRRAAPQEPLFQVVLPRHRIDVAADGDLLSRELAREFPEVIRQIESFYATLTRHNADLDRVFEKDLVWPADTFFERRELARAATQSPFGRDGRTGDPFAEFPEQHPFRLFVEAQARFAGGLDPDDPTALLLTRLHGTWMRGTLAYEGGLDGFRRMLFEKIAMHSGEVRERDRVEALIVKGGRVTAVQLAGHDQRAGCNFVVWGSSATGLPGVLPPDALARKSLDRLALLRVIMRRHVLSVVVESHGIPGGMGRDVFSVLDPGAPLAGHNLLHVQVDASAADHRVLTVESLVPADPAPTTASLEGHAERVLEHLATIVPFLDQNRRAVVGSSSLETMEPIWAVDRPGALGLTGLSTRVGLKNLLLASREVVPALRFEGPLLAAWGVARLITRTDRKKERMRRELWAKIEI